MRKLIFIGLPIQVFGMMLGIGELGEGSIYLGLFNLNWNLFFIIYNVTMLNKYQRCD